MREAQRFCAKQLKEKEINKKTKESEEEQM
jgi:hypothetical protein